MAKWLFKEEPSHFSFADLQQSGRTSWEGVVNNLARQHLRKVRCGDLILFYHTGKEKAVVGVMRACEDAKPDPDADPGAVVLSVEADRELSAPVSLKRIKAEPSLASWDLVRNSRLSVMPVTDVQWRRIMEIAKHG